MNNIQSLSLFTSKRFLKAYRKSSLGLQNLAEGAAHDLIRRFRSDPKTVLHHYDRVAHISSPIMEIDLSSGHRMLAAYDENEFTLLDMGTHEVVGKYSADKLAHDHGKSHSAPTQFWPEQKARFFMSYPDRTQAIQFAAELSADWIYYLAEDQGQIFDFIADHILENESTQGVVQPHFIVGGPGTGKTCILLNLLKLFADEGYQVGIVISSQIAHYVEKSTHANIAQYRVAKDEFGELDLLLVDDPHLPQQFIQAGKDAGVKNIVIAFDPLQLSWDLTDALFNQIVLENKVFGHTLTCCYRQKENVGKATKNTADIIASSTPFLSTDKIKNFQERRKEITSLANEITFINPHGYVEYYTDTTIADIRSEVERILNDPHPLWEHYPGLLILEYDVNLSEAAVGELAPLFRRNYIHMVSFQDIEQIKGLEFQHVFIFIESDLYEEIEDGFKGTGQSEYHRRRLLRIPFSRAKDSLVTFVL